MSNPAQEAPEAPATDDAEASKAPADPAAAAAPVEGQAPAQKTAPATPAAADDEAQKSAETPSEKAGQEPAEDVNEGDDADDADDANEGDDADEGGLPPAARKLLAKTRREAKSLRERLHKAEAELMRRDVGADVGVPAALVSRLSGDTVEAMTADAKALMGSLGLQPTATPPGLPRETAPQPPTPPARSSAEDLDARAARMFGR